jgi:multidrug efflux pump
MNAIIDAALGRVRMVLTALLLLILAGYVGYRDMPKESNPDVNIPVIYVSLSLEGVSPEDAERLLVRPMEQELQLIEGVKEMTSTAYQGGGNVLLEFDAGFDADRALEDVRNKVDDAKAELPDEADEPTVNEVNLSEMPVLIVSLSGDLPLRTLMSLARNLRDEIEGIDSVLEARVAGEREEVVEIVIDPVRAESYGLNANDIAALVSRSNRLVAAGTLDTGQGRFAIKVPGLFETARDILDMPLKVDGDAIVRVRDVGNLKRTFKDAESYARMNGQPTIGLEVSKRAGENIIDTVAAIRAAVEAERASWPAQVQVAYSQDQSAEILNMLSDLENNLISAVILIMIVVVLSLGWRSATLVGIAVPGSFLIGILWLQTGDLTLNIVVLFSLILAVGEVVDGAIVLTEYADRRMSEGMPRLEAYRLAAKRMAWPIVASTATTLAVYVPLLVWPGTVGEFMKYIPLTVLATLAASLLMALIFVPALGTVFGAAADPAAAARALAETARDSLDPRSLPGFTGAYARILDRTLDRPSAVLAVTVAVLFGAWFAYFQFGKGVEFFPEVEPDVAAINIHARGNLSIDERDALVREVEAQVLAVQRERGEFKTVYATTEASVNTGSDLTEDVIGIIRLEFAKWDRRRKADEIIAEIRERTQPLAGIFIESQQQEAGPPVGKPVQVQLSSQIPDLLDEAAAKLRGFMEAMPGLVDVDDTRPVPGIEWEIAVDRAQAAKFGLDVTDVGNAVQLITKGQPFAEFRPDDSDDEIDIVARYPDEYRNIAELDRIRIATPEGLVPIANFVERVAKPKVGVIERVDGERALTVRADVLPGVLVDSEVAQIRAWLAQAELDPRLNVTFKGEDEEQAESQAFLTQAFFAALFLIAVILLTQFNSFYNSALILSAVVMSTIGVMIGLLIEGQPFGIVMTGIGVIALAGIVVKNNIILIDTYDQLKLTEPTARDAIVKTAAQRLRPVLLTALTTVLGLLPMVYQVNIDFIAREITVGAPSTQWWVQLSTAIVYGLTFATVLTLIVTPSALMLRANLGAWRAAKRARSASRRQARAPAAAE